MDARDVTITVLAAGFDSSKAAQLRKQFKQHVALGRINHVLDIDAVEVLDSAALGALITILRLVREQGGSVRVVAKREAIRRILSITALDRIFGVHASVEEAQGAFGIVADAPETARPQGARAARRVAAVVAGLALVLGFRPVAAQAPLDAQTIIARVVEQNPSLQTYQAHVHVQVRMTSFPYLAPRLEGETYFKRPNNYEVVFTRVPAYAKGFERIYADIGDPAAWEKHFVVTRAGERVVNGHQDVVLNMVQRVRGMIDHQLVFIDENSYKVDGMEWHYYNGGTIAMSQEYRTEGAFSVIAAQHVNIDIPHVRAAGSAVYTNYQTNVALDERVFTRSEGR